MASTHEELDVANELDRALRTAAAGLAQTLRGAARNHVERRRVGDGHRQQAWRAERDAARSHYVPWTRPGAVQRGEPRDAAKAWATAAAWAEVDPHARVARDLLAEQIEALTGVAPAQLLHDTNTDTNPGQDTGRDTGARHGDQLGHDQAAVPQPPTEVTGDQTAQHFADQAADQAAGHVGPTGRGVDDYTDLLDAAAFEAADVDDVAAAWQTAVLVGDEPAAQQLADQIRGHYGADPDSYLTAAVQQHDTGTLDTTDTADLGGDPAVDVLDAAKPADLYDRAAESDLAGLDPQARQARVGSGHGFSQSTADMLRSAAERPGGGHGGNRAAAAAPRQSRAPRLTR